MRVTRHGAPCLLPLATCTSSHNKSFLRICTDELLTHWHILTAEERPPIHVWLHTSSYCENSPDIGVNNVSINIDVLYMCGSPVIGLCSIYFESFELILYRWNLTTGWMTGVRYLAEAWIFLFAPNGEYSLYPVSNRVVKRRVHPRLLPKLRISGVLLFP
jgi:hypothetical protein